MDLNPPVLVVMLSPPKAGEASGRGVEKHFQSKPGFFPSIYDGTETNTK